MPSALIVPESTFHPDTISAKGTSIPPSSPPIVVSLRASHDPGVVTKVYKVPSTHTKRDQHPSNPPSRWCKAQHLASVRCLSNGNGKICMSGVCSACVVVVQRLQERFSLGYYYLLQQMTGTLRWCHNHLHGLGSYFISLMKGLLKK
jgi:hypothetical protein